MAPDDDGGDERRAFESLESDQSLKLIYRYIEHMPMQSRLMAAAARLDMPVFRGFLRAELAAEPAVDLITKDRRFNMRDNDQARRERAYKIWEMEGRPEGRHLDHWERADEDGEAIEKDAAEVTEANRHASRRFDGKNGDVPSVPDTRPPSVSSPD